MSNNFASIVSSHVILTSSSNGGCLIACLHVRAELCACFLLIRDVFDVLAHNWRGGGQSLAAALAMTVFAIVLSYDAATFNCMFTANINRGVRHRARVERFGQLLMSGCTKGSYYSKHHGA